MTALTVPIIVCAVAWIVLIVALKIQGVEIYLCGTVGGLLAVLFYVVLYNRMMAYVENHAYQATPDKETETKDT